MLTFLSAALAGSACLIAGRLTWALIAALLPGRR
jgi:hypothetical protein